jgi:predicted double-glycine peptidase
VRLCRSSGLPHHRCRAAVSGKGLQAWHAPRAGGRFALDCSPAAVCRHRSSSQGATASLLPTEGDVTGLLLLFAWAAMHSVGLDAPLPVSHHIRGVPLVERNANWCGPAALAAVLRYYGEGTQAKEIAEAIYLPDFRGSLNLDLLVFARRRGYTASAEEGTARRLREAIARDRPVICMVTRRNPVLGRNHMVVVRGYDRSRAVVFLDGGEGAEQTVRTADFEAAWAESGRWMLVVEGKAAAAAAAGGPGRCVAF